MTAVLGNETLAGIFWFVFIIIAIFLCLFLKSKNRLENELEEINADNEDDEDDEDNEDEKVKIVKIVKVVDNRVVDTYCQYCGSKIKHGETKCPDCGASVKRK